MRKAPRRGLRLAKCQFLLFLLVCFLLPDVIADDLFRHTDGADAGPACPKVVAREVALPPQILPMNADRRLPFQEPHRVRHTQLRWNTQQDMHVIRQRVPFHQLHAVPRSARPGSLLTLAPHRSGRAGSAASGSSTAPFPPRRGFATRRRVPAGPGSQAMATAIPKAYLASSAIRCRDVETGPNLGVLAVFPSTGATCRCPLPSTA